MQAVSDRAVRPWHRLMSRLCSHFTFSAAEALIALGVIAALIYIVYTVIGLIRRPQRLTRIYRFALSCLTAFALIYGGFCLLWGTYYYSADFEEQSGIRGAPASVEQLTAVTRYFTDLVNQYDAMIARGEDLAFAENMDDVFDRSPLLYRNVETALPCLRGDALSAKPVICSRIMSYINFTGFFFPFTGEANIFTWAMRCTPRTMTHGWKTIIGSQPDRGGIWRTTTSTGSSLRRRSARCPTTSIQAFCRATARPSALKHTENAWIF